MAATGKDRADLERVKQAMMDYLNALKEDVFCQIVHELFDHEEFQITLAYDLRTPIDEMFVDWTRVPYSTKIQHIAQEHQVPKDQLVCIEFRELVRDQDLRTLRMQVYFDSPRLESIFTKYQNTVFTRTPECYSLDIQVVQGQPESLQELQARLGGIFAEFDLLFSAAGQDVGFFLLNTDCYITYYNPDVVGTATSAHAPVLPA